MKNIHEVLREKQANIKRLERERKVLREAARILENENLHAADAKTDGADSAVSILALGVNGDKPWS